MTLSAPTRSTQVAKGHSHMIELAKRLILRIFGTGFAAIIQAISYLLIARVAGPAVYGTFATLFAIGTIVTVVSGFGFSSRALVVSNTPQGLAELSTMVKLRLVTSTITAALLFGIGTVLFSMEIAGAAAFIVLIEINSDLIQGLLSGQNKQSEATRLLITIRILVSAPIVFATLTDNSVWIGLIIGCVVNVVVIAIKYRPYMTNAFDPRQALRTAAPFWLAQVMTNLRQLDVIILKFASTEVIAGLYAVASRILGPLNLVSVAITQIFTPQLHILTTSSDRIVLFRKMRRISLVYASTLAISAIPLTSIMIWLLGEDYSAGRWIYVGAILSAAIASMSQTYQSLLYAAGYAQMSAKIVLWGSLTMLVLITLAALRGDVNLIAIVAPAGQLLILTLFHYCSRRVRRSSS